MKKALIRLDEKTYRFFHSTQFWLLLALVIYLGWLQSDMRYAFVAFCCLSCLVLVFQSDVRLFSLSAFMAMASFPAMPYFNSLTFFDWGIIVCALSLLPLLFIKRIILYPLKGFSFGSCGFSFILLALSAFLSTFVNQLVRPGDAYIGYGYFFSGILALILPFYFGPLLGSAPDHFAFLKKAFYVINALLVAQLIAKWGTPDYFNVGWGTKNLVVMVLEFCLPFLALIFADDHSRYDALALIFVDYYLSCVSDSRGGLITVFVLTFILALILTSSKGIYRWHSFLFFIGVLCSFMVFSFMVIPSFKESVLRLLDMGTDLSHREEIWAEAMKYYYADPYVGGGSQSMFSLWEHFNWYPGTIGLMYSHDTYITILSAYGLLGLAVYILQILEISYSGLKAGGNQGWLIAYVLLAGLIHGIIDNTYLTLIYMLPYVMVFSDPSLISLTDRFFFKKTKKAIGLKA